MRDKLRVHDVYVAWEQGMMEYVFSSQILIFSSFSLSFWVSNVWMSVTSLGRNHCHAAETYFFAMTRVSRTHFEAERFYPVTFWRVVFL